MPDALSFFLGIREIGFLRGKTLLVTTPNATGLHNAILGLFSRESTHAGHLAVHSFKTLNTLCRKTMFESWDLVPYHVSFAEMILRSGGASKAAILCCEKVVDCFETLFPLLSGGWIVNIRI
jgi:hypothetical protein